MGIISMSIERESASDCSIIGGSKKAHQGWGFDFLYKLVVYSSYAIHFCIPIPEIEEPELAQVLILARQ